MGTTIKFRSKHTKIPRNRSQVSGSIHGKTPLLLKKNGLATASASPGVLCKQAQGCGKKNSPTQSASSWDSVNSFWAIVAPNAKKRKPCVTQSAPILVVSVIQSDFGRLELLKFSLGWIYQISVGPLRSSIAPVLTNQNFGANLMTHQRFSHIICLRKTSSTSQRDRQWSICMCTHVEFPPESRSSILRPH